MRARQKTREKWELRFPSAHTHLHLFLTESHHCLISAVISNRRTVRFRFIPRERRLILCFLVNYGASQLSSGTEGWKSLALSGKMDITHNPLGEQRDHGAAEDLNPRGQRQQRWTRRRTNGAVAMVDSHRRRDNQIGRLLTCSHSLPSSWGRSVPLVSGGLTLWRCCNTGCHCVRAAAGGVGQGGVMMVRTAPPTDPTPPPSPRPNTLTKTHKNSH